MSAPKHRILDLSQSAADDDSAQRFSPGDSNCHMHSLLAWEWQQGMSIPLAEAADHLLIHLASGSLEAEIDGVLHHCAQNHCLWIPKQSQRQLRANSDSIFIAAHFDMAHTHRQRLQVHQFVSPSHPDDYQQLVQMLRQYGHSPVDLFQIAAVFYRNLCHRSLLLDIISLQTLDEQDPLVASTIAALEQNPTLSVEACARLHALGVTRFRQRFHAATGSKPSAFITRFRCIRAAQLLQETDLSVAEISQSCGYENPNYLYRVFKQQHHCTPQAFRMGKRNSV